MTATTGYGSWANCGDSYNATVEDTVAGYLSGGGREWCDQVVSTGAFERMVADYRAAINAALPPEVTLDGDLFHGPYPWGGVVFDGFPQNERGDLDIAAIVHGVDLPALVARHDPDND